MIKDFTPRLYQQTIFASASEKNTLVVLPTGLGKTFIFLMLAAHRLKLFPHSKILFLGPTKPLISQYLKEFKKHLEIDDKDLAMFTGNVTPEKREKLWMDAKIIFSTPQGLENDIISNRIKLDDVSLIGFDEAHRATGEYSYTWIAKQYMKKSKKPLILGLTASPGSDAEKIMEVVSNLQITNIEIRGDEDPDVKPYIQEVKVKWVYVELPQHFNSVLKYLKNCYESKVMILKNKTNAKIENKSDLLALQGSLLSRIKDNDIESMMAMSVLAEAIKVQHALELLESQGITPLLDYMNELMAKATLGKTKAVKNLVADPNFKSALIIARNLKELNIEHPKIQELKNMLKDAKEDTKIIVFSQFRDSITNLVNEINKLENVKSAIFVGQQKKKGIGMSQKDQINMLERFKNNEFNVLVMSSVGEEGLDIPAVDKVIFYEPVPSAIRTIQRRGRTGRQSKGEVIVLVTKGTRDEGYRWSAFHKENRMQKIMNNLKMRFYTRTADRKISEFILPENGITIYADHREKSSGVIKKLLDLGIDIKLVSLEVGDYLLSDDLCIEYKTVPDFVDSLLDKRLFTQLRNMKKYSRQIIILEGKEDIFSQRNLHPNAIRGMLATIAIDYCIPIIYTKDADESALMLAMIAKREVTENKEFTMHTAKPITLKEQQEYIISALPGVGPALCKPLLEKFGSVKKVLNANEERLKEVDLIGEKKAAKIREIVDSDYING
ncbi:MAG: DEAD/DEAH box helicase [Candidatus Woesearchaeota archaeon]|nr:DEAD/DEAH box helicase [Candidatus Woesearchaeota archaeon]